MFVARDTGRLSVVPGVARFIFHGKGRREARQTDKRMRPAA